MSPLSLISAHKQVMTIQHTTMVYFRIHSNACDRHHNRMAMDEDFASDQLRDCGVQLMDKDFEDAKV